MCDRLNSLVYNDKLTPSGDSGTRATPTLGSYWERVEYRLTYLSFVSFDAPRNPVRLMHEKRTASIQFLILRLIIRCAVWS